MYAFLLFTDQPRSLLSRRPMQVCDAGLQIYCIVYGQKGIYSGKDITVNN